MVMCTPMISHMNACRSAANNTPLVPACASPALHLAKLSRPSRLPLRGPEDHSLQARKHLAYAKKRVEKCKCLIGMSTRSVHIPHEYWNFVSAWRVNRLAKTNGGRGMYAVETARWATSKHSMLASGCICNMIMFVCHRQCNVCIRK